MKKQNNRYYEYIDQFRKISTLEKLPTLNNRLQNMFEDDVEKDNNNFMRLRKQPIIDRWDNPENQNIILANQCVQQKVDNLLEQQHQEYQNQDGKVRGHINMFKQWSQLNKDIHNKNQSFKFFYKNASPPKKTSDQTTLEKQQSKLKQKTKLNQFKLAEDNQKSQLDLLNIGARKLKYDFKIINERRMDEFLQKPERQQNNQSEKEEDLFQHEFRKFDKYKTLEDISSLDEVKIAEQDFFYDLNNPDEDILKLDKYFLDKFIYKSVTKSLKDTEKDVEYFRDIGLPSRNLDRYSQVVNGIRGGKETLQEDIKQQAHFLHLLRESELNINKNDINYDDISNISNGRVTSLNAYMCIRSEKVIKAQFEKLLKKLKKLDKYKKQEMQKGKQKKQIGIITEDIDLQFNTNDRLAVKQQKNSINELINQISEIRQTTVLMKPRKQKDDFQIMDSNFDKEKFTRMQALLKKLYDKIVVNSSKYPFTYLEENLDKIQEILADQYKDGKLLWYIVDCYDQILNKLPDEDNIKSILKKKPVNGPKLAHYKGTKLLKQQKLKSINLFTYRDKSKSPMQIPTNDGSKVKQKVTKSTITNTNMKQTNRIDGGWDNRVRRQVTPRKTAIKKPFYTKVSPNSFSKTQY